jgi:hypothetical protein
MVIDLPTAEGSLERAFLQFEDAAEVDSPPEGLTFLDVQETRPADEVAREPSLAGVVAEFSVPDSPMLDSAPAPSVDLAPQDADLAQEREAAQVPDVPIGSEDVESPLAAEVAAQVEILPPIDLPDAVGLETPIVGGLAADVSLSAPVVAEPLIVDLVETPFSGTAEVLVVADEAPPFGVAEEIVVAVAEDPAFHHFADSVPATGEASVFAAAEAPVVEVRAAEATDAREMPAAARAEHGQFSETAEPPGLGDPEVQRAAVDLPVVAVVGEADRVAPAEAADQDAATVAPAVDFQAGPWANTGVAAVPDASGPDVAAPVVWAPEDTADVPKVSWEPEPAPVEEDDLEVPALAAATVHVSDADAELLAPHVSARRTAGRDAAPIAALEAFLRKISARRLHLTPGSVA